MSARYEVGDDGHDDPTIWDTSESELFPRAILRRSDLPESARELWPVICEAVTGQEALLRRIVSLECPNAPEPYAENCEGMVAIHRLISGGAA